MDSEHLYASIEDEASIAKIYQENGVVCVTGVLTRDECRETLHDIDSLLPKGCSIFEPNSYGLADEEMNKYGVIGDSPLFLPTLVRNRVHPNVYKAQSIVYGTTEIVAQHDRVAWMRPTLPDHPEWATPYEYPGLHLDVDPRAFCGDVRPVKKFLGDLQYNSTRDLIAENNAWNHSMGIHVQGVLNLIDNRDCVEDFNV